MAPVPPMDLDYLSGNGYVVSTTKEEHDREVDEVSSLSQMIGQMSTEKVRPLLEGCP